MLNVRYPSGPLAAYEWVMLKRFVVENYRCFKRAELVVPPSGLVVLIGANGTGKSTLLEAIDLVARATREPRGLVDAAIARGGISELPMWGSPDQVCRFEVDAHLLEEGGPHHLAYSYRVAVKNDPRGPWVEEENFQITDAQIPPSKLLARTELVRTEGTGRLVLQPAAKTMVAFDGPSHQTALSFENGRDGKVFKVKELADSRVYACWLTAPGWQQNSYERGDGPRSIQAAQPVDYLHSRGVDLANVLATLDENHRVMFNRLVDDFRAEFPFVESLGIQTVPVGKRTLKWKHLKHAQPKSVDTFSEGMLAYLLLLAALYAQDAPHWIGFDEPESHLHPRLLRRVVAIMEARAEKTPIIVATHSDALLDCLSEPADAVHIVESGQDGSVIRKLDKDALKAWLEEFRLGELRTNGHLDGHLREN